MARDALVVAELKKAYEDLMELVAEIEKDDEPNLSSVLDSKIAAVAKAAADYKKARMSRLN